MLANIAVTALIAAAVGFGAGWQTQAWRYDAKELAAKNKALDKARMQRQGADAGAVAFEVVREKLRTEYIPILQEVERVAVQYRDRECLAADGVRLINDAIRSANNPGEPRHPLPAASGAP